MPWEYSRRTASAEEARRGIVGDPDTRPLDPSSSSTDPNPKRLKTTSVTDNDSLANQMDEEVLERMDASEIHAGRLNAKEVFTPENGCNIYYSRSQMEQSNYLEEIRF